MAGLMKRLGLAIVLVLLLALVALGGFGLWLGLRDPLAALPVSPDLPQIAAERQERQPGRLLRHLTFTDPVLGTIGLTVSLPDPLPDSLTDHALPVVILLGGLGLGAENIRHLGDPGPNAVIGYDWPFPPRLPRGPDLLGM